MGYPVIYVHGIGASAKAWKNFKIPDHASFYISFSNRFANPANQVPELGKFIDNVLKQTKEEKVILICHSMGGLVARQYLADYKDSHKVEKLILLSAPNLGSIGLFFNWLPLALIIIGLFGYNYVWPLFFCLIALVWEVSSFLRGVLLLSPAAWAMRPHSSFLKQLNSKNMPENVKYVSVLSDTKDLPHWLVNLFLFREKGDGAVPHSSQQLSLKSVPNFEKLDYSEIQINLPHFVIPRQAEQAILQALAL
ncbi:MAG: alpha/beta fold hydrolase [Candidatus Margulisbacteria bacterium]|nr:alpha/beta fold hydrolase [Candidatus Margulisiibacteriota bacterium]